MSRHPKERMIPRALLKYKAFKKFEDKVILGLHVFELTLILLIAVVTASMATFLPRTGTTETGTGTTETGTGTVIPHVVGDVAEELLNTEKGRLNH
jgi:hypothetical protein